MHRKRGRGQLDLKKTEGTYNPTKGLLGRFQKATRGAAEGGQKEIKKGHQVGDHKAKEVV